MNYTLTDPVAFATILELDSQDAPDEAARDLVLPYSWRLDDLDYYWAVQVGAVRCYKSVLKGDKPAHGCGRNHLYDINIIGTTAERAISILLDKAWPAHEGVYHTAADLDQEEVRGTVGPDNRLYITNTDNLDHRYWLVRVDGPRVEVVGWIRGYDAYHLGCKDPSSRRNPPTSWYIPNECLKTYVPLLSKTWMRPGKETSPDLKGEPIVSQIEPINTWK